MKTKQISLSFDDAPRAGTLKFDGPTRAKRLIEQLHLAKVPRVVFYANSSLLDEEGRERLISYANAGHLIANHTHSHPNFNRTALPQFIADFHQADKLLRPLKGFTPYFRFPYLNEGDDIGKRNAMRSELEREGYRNGYITVDNWDWEIDRLLQEAIGKSAEINYELWSERYVKILIDCVEHTDALARKILNRSPKQVMLLHENDVNALFIGNFITELRKQGWEIIDPIDAYNDPIATYETNRLFQAGTGRIAEIALDQGYDNGLQHQSCNKVFLAELFS